MVLKFIELWLLLQQNERAAQYKNNTVTPETRLILQQWMWSDYQLYNYFNHKLSEQIKEIGQEKVTKFQVADEQQDQRPALAPEHG